MFFIVVATKVGRVRADRGRKMGQMKKDEEVGQTRGQASKCASVSAPYQQAACSNIYFNALSHGQAKTYT